MITLTGILNSPQGLKDGTMKVSINFNEQPPEKLGALFAMNNKFLYVALKEEPFLNEEKKLLEELKSDEQIGKSPSQRVRSTLYVLYDQDNEGFASFDQYYKFKIEKYIDFLKSKIND
jgi:hypothetical protein